MRAIAKEVFNLTCIMWDLETNDWCLQSDGTTACPGQVPGKDRASVDAAIQAGLHGSKATGKIPLEHELRDKTLAVFKAYYPQLKQLGWNAKSIADLGTGTDWYENAADDNVTPQAQANILPQKASKAVSGNVAANGTANSSAAQAQTSQTASTKASSGVTGSIPLAAAAFGPLALAAVLAL